MIWVSGFSNASSLKDDDLAGRMGLQVKELNKIMAVLENDRLIKVYVSCTLVCGTSSYTDSS